MNLGLINSAWAQAGKDTAYGIRMTKEIGFDTIDIFADPLDIDVRERRLIRLECERIGLPIVSIACVAVGLIDFNPSVQRFHLERCRKYLDLAYEYEARNVLLLDTPLQRRAQCGAHVVHAAATETSALNGIHDRVDIAWTDGKQLLLPDQRQDVLADVA